MTTSAGGVGAVAIAVPISVLMAVLMVAMVTLVALWSAAQSVPVDHCGGVDVDGNAIMSSACRGLVLATCTPYLHLTPGHPFEQRT